MKMEMVVHSPSSSPSWASAQLSSRSTSGQGRGGQCWPAMAEPCGDPLCDSVGAPARLGQGRPGPTSLQLGPQISTWPLSSQPPCTGPWGEGIPTAGQSQACLQSIHPVLCLSRGLSQCQGCAECVSSAAAAGCWDQWACPSGWSGGAFCVSGKV